MSKNGRTTEQILKDAEQILNTARFGLDDLTKGRPERRVSGLLNLVTFGRAVTNVLQNLRSNEQEFDNWYAKYQKEMTEDELLKYFYKLRSVILKEGQVNVGTSAYINQFNYPVDMSKFGKPPPNAKGFFIGDRNGGTGWEVQFQDGTTAKYYVELPSEIGKTWFIFPDPPTNHLGKQIQDTSVEFLSKIYLDYIAHLVEMAKQEFLLAKASSTESIH